MEPVMEEYPHYFRDDFGPVESHLRPMPGRLLAHDELKNSPAISMVAQIADNIIARTRSIHNIIEPIKFTLVDSSVANAMAIRAGGVDCIAISLELVFSLAAATSRLFASSRFPLIWKSEEFPTLTGPFERSRQQAMHRVLIHIDEAIDPTDESMALWQVCVEFIVLHELGHTINGHIRSGIRNNIDKLEESLTRRTTELDADCFAVKELIRRAIQDSSSPNYIGYNLTNNTRSRLLTFMTAVAVVIYAFEANAWQKAGEYQTSTHPPAYIRNWACSAAAVAVVDLWTSRGMEPISDFDELSQRALYGTFLAIAELGRCGFDREEFYRWHSVVVAHDTANLIRWAQVRPTLEAFKYGSHALAPAQF
jgi:hypothetical protein